MKGKLQCDLRVAPIPLAEHRGLFQFDVADGHYVFVCSACLHYLVLERMYGAERARIVFSQISSDPLPR